MCGNGIYSKEERRVFIQWSILSIVPTFRCVGLCGATLLYVYRGYSNVHVDLLCYRHSQHFTPDHLSTLPSHLPPYASANTSCKYPPIPTSALSTASSPPTHPNLYHAPYPPTHIPHCAKHPANSLQGLSYSSHMSQSVPSHSPCTPSSSWPWSAH